MSGSWQVASMTSSSRDLPQRFSGARITSRGACAHAGCTWVAAIHSTTASVVASDGRITNRVSAARTSSSRAAASTGALAESGADGGGGLGRFEPGGLGGSLEFGGEQLGRQGTAGYQPAEGRS